MDCLIRPVVDEEKREQVQALIHLQLTCFALQLLAGVIQVSKKDSS